MQPQNLAYSSSGQDSRFSFLQQGFDSPIGYLLKTFNFLVKGFFYCHFLLSFKFQKKIISDIKNGESIVEIQYRQALLNFFHLKLFSMNMIRKQRVKSISLLFKQMHRYKSFFSNKYAFLNSPSELPSFAF